MKLRPFLSVALVIAAMFSLNSCVKKYTCHCDIKYSGMPGLPDSTFQEYEIKDTKSGAEEKCKAESFAIDANGIHTEERCYLY